MENSGNLKYPSWPVLLTNPSAANLNVFKNPVTNLIELVLPQHGKSIPLGTNTYVSVTLPNIATKKVGGIDLTGVYPASDVNYEYGFTIEMLRKQPGVDNDEYWPLMFHFYDKMNTILPPASGEVDIQNADQLTMITNLLAQANASQVGEEYNLTDLVEVGYKFTMTINVGATTGLTFGGTSLPTDTLANLINNTAGITVIPMALVSGAIYNCTVLVPYSVGIPNAAAIAVITKYGIFLRSKTEVWDWNVKIDEFQWDEHKFSYIQYGSITAALAHRYNYGANTALSSAFVASNSNRGVATGLDALTGVYALGVDTAFTTAYIEDEVMTVYPLAAATIVTPSDDLPPTPYGLTATQYISYGSKTVWKQLTADQVFKTFAHMQNLGELSVLTRGDQPADEEYVKIAIVHKGHVHASMHSASGYGHGEQRLYIYMPKAKFILKTGFMGKNTFEAASFPVAAGNYNSPAMLFDVLTSSAQTYYGNAVPTGGATGWKAFIEAWDPD